MDRTRLIGHDPVVTLVVAVIDKTTGATLIAADSKVTWTSDDARSRRIYTEPALKVILLSEELAVGFAGEGPEHLAGVVAGLAEAGTEDVLDALSAVEGGSFVVVQARPARLWEVSKEGGVVDKTSIGRAWAGSRSAFGMFQRRFDDIPGDSAISRACSAMSHVVHLAQPEGVGGYVVAAAAQAQQSFRYLPFRASLWPRAEGPTTGEVKIRSDGKLDLTLRTSFLERPLSLIVCPGGDTSPGALGLYVENSGGGHLFPQGRPAERIDIRADSREAFAEIALAEHSQNIET